MEAAAYLWTISAALLILVLFKSSKLLNNLSSKIVIASLSTLSIFYIGLQTYGIINNNYYEPITSFIQKEQNIKFITVKTTKRLFEEINKSNEPVMVDLYADWCVACKELEKYTFSDERVSEKLNKLKLIKFDITETTEEHSKYLQSMMIFGPPALFFFNEDGNEIIDARIVGFMDSEDFLKVLKLVKN